MFVFPFIHRYLDICVFSQFVFNKTTIAVKDVLVCFVCLKRLSLHAFKPEDHSWLCLLIQDAY